MRNGLSRRDFVKTAVAVGGYTALSACLELEGNPDVAQGPTDLSGMPSRQHAWDEYLSRDSHGNVVAPRHRVLLLLNYNGDDIEEDREVMEEALKDLESAYKRGNDGLLFTISYSPNYFERNDVEYSADLQQPSALASFESPELENNDAVLHLASDYPHVVLEAEQALFGELNELNGVSAEHSLSDIFETEDRRTGFVGTGLPAENQDVEGIPQSKPVSKDSPLYMGFKSGFKKNQASEDRVTIREGKFSGGTTQHVSKLDLNLNQWYEQDSRYQRVGKMFCPVHAEEELVEGVGENLGDTDQIEERGCPAHTGDHAEEFGMVGHSQKSARARKDGSPLIIRRDFDSTNEGEKAGLHFVALQRGTQEFVDTRESMNGSDIAEESAVGQRTNNGILQYINVERRGNYLLPPREKRSLPV